LADSIIIWIGGFHNDGVNKGDSVMIHSIGRTKVVLVITILLATIVIGQTTSNSNMAIARCEVSDIGLISQTYTDHAAIFVDGNADFLSQALAESWEGTGTAGSPIVIDGYRITDTTTEGIKLWNVDLHWIVRNCLIVDGPSACGFSIDNCSNGEFSNNIIQNRDVGVQAYEGTYNCSFTNNQILTNQDTAFKVLGGMGNCIISGNNFSGNVGNNFWMTGGFNDSQITDNTVTGGQNGIRVTVCLRSSITGNSVSDCGLDALVFPLASGVIVRGNTVTNTTGYGIMTSGNFAEIESNTVVDSTSSGIYIASGDNATITGNLIVNSSEYGLKLASTTANTSVFENSFIDSIGVTSQVLDEGENNVISYNHYSDWVTPDADDNGIVDVAYALDGDATNSDPYPIVDSAGTIPVTATTSAGLPIDPVLIVGIGIVAVVLIVVVFLMKRR
jgi:parallel beta-helix repeat protein